MKKTYLQKGFTLIELLVVIAIIGILSSVVLASLSTARNKGKDAAIQSQLGSMRAQAELYTGTGTAFPILTCSTLAGTIFETANNGLGNLLSGSAMTLANARCVSTAGLVNNGAVWAVASQMTTGVWCVDSTGISRNLDASGTKYTDLASALTGTSCK